MVKLLIYFNGTLSETNQEGITMHMLKEGEIFNAICTSASLSHILSGSETESANHNYLTNASNIFLNHVIRSNKVISPQKKKKEKEKSTRSRHYHRKLNLRCFKFKNFIRNWK